MLQDQLTDYTREHVFLPLVIGDSKGYASINAEFYIDYEEGIDKTGCYLVYLLHPVLGGMQFKLSPDNSFNGWEIDDESYWPKRPELVPIIQQITDAIEKHFNTRNAGNIPVPDNQ